MRAGARIDLPHCGAAGFVLHAVFGGVAVGTYGDVEVRSIRAGDEILRPVVIDGPGRQIQHFGAGCGDVRLSRHVAKAQYRIRIRDEQLVADQCHSKGRVQALDEHRPCVRDSGATSVAQ